MNARQAFSEQIEKAEEEDGILYVGAFVGEFMLGFITVDKNYINDFYRFIDANFTIRMREVSVRANETPYELPELIRKFRSYDPFLISNNCYG